MRFLPSNVSRFVYPLLLLIIVFAVSIESAYAQRQSVKRTSSGLYYLEYLPSNYKSSGEKSPVIIFLHGRGERGNGPGGVKLLKKNGPPKHIEKGNNMTFKANGSGRSYSFVVISPQLPTSKSIWDPATVDGVVNHVLSKYNIDKDRVYLTGLSLGGGGVWSYVTSSYNKSNKIAAIAPVAGFLGSSKSKKDTKFLADKKVPVWAFHNSGDKVVPLRTGKAPIDGLKSYKPSVAPRFTVYKSNSHNSWSNAYSTDHSKHSPNVYEWLLAQRRGGTSNSPSPSKNQAPVAYAGRDKSIRLPINATTLDGRQSKDEDGSIKKYYWKKVSGPSASIVSSGSASTKIKNLREGKYVFELQVTDNKGASDKDQVQIKILRKKDDKKSDPSPDNDDDKGDSDKVSSAAVRINFNQLSENNASGWNNMSTSPNTNASRSGLKDVKNKNSGISIKLLTSWNDSNDRGYSTKNNSAVYPDKVIRSYYYTTGTEKIQISGLNKNTTYKFSFYASSWFGGNRTAEYSIGSKKTSLNASFNKSKVATLNGIKSNSKGQVTLVVEKASGAKYGFLGAMTIEPQGGSNARAAANQTKNSTMASATSDLDMPSIAVNAYPNPVMDILSVEMAGEKGEIASVALVDALGRVVYNENKTMSGSADTFEIDVNALGLKTGLVFLQVNSPTYGKKVIKLIKQ